MWAAHSRVSSDPPTVFGETQAQAQAQVPHSPPFPPPFHIPTSWFGELVSSVAVHADACGSCLCDASPVYGALGRASSWHLWTGAQNPPPAIPPIFLHLW